MDNSTFCRKTCPMEFTMNEIAGKWKLVILWHIHANDIMRYGELKKILPEISHKILSDKLSELVESKLIYKEIYNQIPPKVEYSLTDKGRTLVPILDMMYNWGIEFIDKE